MKKMKKLVSLLLALVMVMAMAVSVSATSNNYTITINNSTDGYVYTAYQIFTGDTSGTTLSNIEWGNGISQTGISAVYNKYNVSSAADVAEELEDEDDAKEFAAFIAEYLQNGIASTDQGNTYTIETSTAGYYLIENTTVPNEGGAYTSYMLKVVEDVTTSPKSDVPSLDKTVGDINDSDNTTTQGDTDSADYDIGDDVPFTLTATLPSNYADYTTYKLVFHDIMSDGLTFNEDVAVKIGGNTVAVTNYEVQSSIDGTTGETTITITFSNLKTTAAAANSSVVVTYSAELNDKASFMEENNAYLEYSNNPNQTDGSTTGNTPKDKTTVFTFTLTAYKVDSSSQPLSGAGFTLYKYDYDASTPGYVAVGTEITGATSFTWSGLDDGQYKLVETTTPAGYNTMDDLEFKIVATHTEGTVSSLTITDLAGKDLSSDFTTSTSAGTISTNITNYTGAEMPETGGIGTTLFYVIGTLLVLCAAVLLVTRKRMSSEK
ncbi:MAG: isopeptide-forming domain-containing fimbrial protein [Clostridiales bacterium]|nr:isopeptide-forming domain-containing fimbrial protein [Clostridiales bacterium]